MIASLESLCATPAVIVISNFPEVKKQIFSFSNIDSLKRHFKYEEWRDSLKEIVKKILKNFSPPLKDIIPWYLFPFIGFEMVKFAKILESKFELDFKFTENFISSSIFTSKGTIDDCKAARHLVMENSLSLLLRFKIACFYFLEDVIRELWQKLRDDSNFEEALKEYTSDDPVILWSKNLNTKRKISTSDSISGKLKSFSEKVIVYAFTNDNLEGIKFYFKLNTFASFYEEEDKRHLLCSYFVRMPEIFKRIKDSYSLDKLLSADFKNYFFCLIFLLEQVGNETIDLGEDVAFNFLKGLLLWPFQDLFIKYVFSFFDYLDKKKHYLLLHAIVDLIDHKYLGESYNYRLLLRELWINNPCEHKKYFLDVESGVENFQFRGLLSNPNVDNYDGRTIVTKLFLLNKFTADDEHNFLLILKTANANQKEGIARLYLEKFGICEVIPIENLKLLNIFIENLFLNDSDRRKYKEKIAFHQIKKMVTYKKDLDLADQVINWATDPQGIEDLKAIFFKEGFEIDYILKLYIMRDFPLKFFIKVLQWYLGSDERILAWKKKLLFEEWFCESVFGFEHNDYDFEILESLLNWLFHPSDEVMNIKEEMLRKLFPIICIQLFSGGRFIEFTFSSSEKKNILYLCSYSEEVLAKFINDLNEFCTKNCEEDRCLICKRYERIYSSPEAARLRCVFHGRSGDPSKETRDALLSSFSKYLLNAVSNQK